MQPIMVSCGAIYGVQPIDAGLGNLRLFYRSRRLVSDCIEQLPASVDEELNCEYLAFHTCGDGGCGLHALWGVPNDRGQLECAGGQAKVRQTLADLLPSSLRELDQRRASLKSLQAVELSLWHDLTVVALKTLPDREADIFWSIWQSESPAMKKLKRYHCNAMPMLRPKMLLSGDTMQHAMPFSNGNTSHQSSDR